jgi:putative nucleotidyltransferase with HDIG domain
MASKFSTTLQRLPSFFKYVFVVLVVIFISYLFPNNAKFKYEFENGQSWRYEDLNAPFEFAILKPEDQISQEIEALKSRFSPYYEMDLNTARDEKKSFRESFNQQVEAAQSEGLYNNVQNQPDRYLNYGYGIIDFIYDNGVIQLDEQHSEKEKLFVINLRKGNTTQQRTLQSFLNNEKIETIITDSLFNSGLKEAEFLIPLLKDNFKPNVFYSDELTQKFLDDQLASVSGAKGMVRKDELIVQKDGVITDDIYQKLLSYKAKYEYEISSQKSHLGVLIGYILLTSLIVGVFILYLRFHAKQVFESFNQLVFMMMWLVVYSYLVFAVEINSNLSVYMIPFCIVPIVIKIFYNDRLALFTHIVVVLIASFLSSLGYEFTFLQILAGIVAVLANIQVRDWSRFFFSMLYIFLAYGIGYLGLSLIKEGSIQTVDWSIYTWIFLNVFLTLLAYPLIPLLERLFGFTSSITLVELSDMNRPLLKDLSLKAPGTLQHSLQVANLAEAAAGRIGADQLLVKVAALYHDIGKTLNPTYFIENQSGESPHSQLTNLESAKIILDHVVEGEKLAKKYRLPQVLIDFIMTHHGTTRVEYFYRNHIKENPGKEFDESLFRYPGPRPNTKEQTVLMIADSLEASSKSLKNPTEQDINDLVDKIIAQKITSGQLENSEMTFEELEICKEEFRKILNSIYHIRIEYPDEKTA